MRGVHVDHDVFPGRSAKGCTTPPWGPMRYPGTSSGRKERLRSSSGRNASSSLGNTARACGGVVTDTRPRGPRRLVTVQAAGVDLHAEATAGPALATGDTVRIQLPTPALAAVGGAAGHPSAALTSPDWKVLA